MKRSREARENVSDLRQQSRRDYLSKRETQQLELLEREVEDYAIEDQKGQLSRAEKKDYETKRETLRLATERMNIDDGTDGRYTIPDENLKETVLNQRHKEYISEAKQHELDIEAKVKSQVKPAKIQAGDYDFVFDNAASIEFQADTLSNMNAERRALEQLLEKSEQRAKSIEETRKSLPIYQWKDKFTEALHDHQTLVVVAETGSGKTTQLPQYACEALSCSTTGKRIICTQPRRVAAMSVAQRVADEFGCRIGQEVGYQVRFEEKVTPGKTLINYCTEGTLLQIIQNDPSALEDLALVMIDEAHERTINTDLLLSISKDLCRTKPDLKLIISSATLNAQAFCAFFDNAPIFSVPGRAFKVEHLYTKSPEANYLMALVTTVLQIHVSQPLGDILCFLPGVEEINFVQEALQTTVDKIGSRIKNMILAPIYANLPNDQQQKIFDPTPQDSRKVILATNIAETSITIDNVLFVVDTGYERQLSYSPSTNISALITTPISRASANQRAGRAGRTAPGKAFRLYPREIFYREMPESTPPEITRVSLTSTCLLLKSIGVNDLIHFDFMDPPPIAAIQRSLEHLYALGALASNGILTKTGRMLANLPLEPFLGKAILAASEYKCVEEVLAVVSILPESGSLYFRPKGREAEADGARSRFAADREGGDILAALKVWQEWTENEFSGSWAKDSFVDQKTLLRSRLVFDQLRALCDRIGIEVTSCGIQDHISIRKALSSGFILNAAHLTRDGKTYKTLSGTQLAIHPSSCLRKDQPPRFVCFYEAVLTSREFMRNVWPVEVEWLHEVAPHLYSRKDLDKLGWGKKMPKGPKANANSA